MKTLRKWWKPALAIVLAVIALQAGVSLLVRTSRVHGYLVAQLARAFGRPVEVATFDVRILPSPQLDANNVTVGEDPGFGYEYFLRAERLSAGLRWCRSSTTRSESVISSAVAPIRVWPRRSSAPSTTATRS